MDRIKMLESVESGLKALIHAQDPEGWWGDFRLAPGRSTLWVTAYVGRILAFQTDAVAVAAAGRAWQWLSGHGQRGWGYNPYTPEDADSTAWTISLAEALGAGDSDRIEKARAFLQGHCGISGGIATYGSDLDIRRFIGAPAELSFDGWCRPQVCVTAAAAANGLGGAGALEYLRATQADDGRWRSYWWCEDEYATALAASALDRYGAPADRERIARAVGWAMGRITADGYVGSFLRPHGSIFATAWVLRLLLLDPTGRASLKEAHGVARWLAAQQDSRGFWPASAGLRVPPPDQDDPDRYKNWVLGKRIEGGISLDDNGIFTTATVVESLQGFEPRMPEPGATPADLF